jgi:hypothetical protein
MAMIRVLVFSMIVGLSLAHADDNGHPFGIQPRQQTVWADTVAETRSWKRQFLSLADFIKVIQQPYFHVLISGESPDLYYVIFRADPNILVFAYAFRKDEKSNGSFELHSRTEDWSNKMKLVDLLDTDVTTSTPGRPDDTQWQGYSLLRFAALIPPGYAGPITLSFKLFNLGQDKFPLKGSPTFTWK